MDCCYRRHGGRVAGELVVESVLFDWRRRVTISLLVLVLFFSSFLIYKGVLFERDLLSSSVLISGRERKVAVLAWFEGEKEVQKKELSEVVVQRFSLLKIRSLAQT